MNLSGFCAADAKDCGTIAAQSGASAAASAAINAAINGPYAAQAAGITKAVGGALYRIAAHVGTRIVCPTLPILGGSLGGTIGALTLPETIELGPISIKGLELATAAGIAAGEAIQKELCG